MDALALMNSVSSSFSGNGHLILSKSFEFLPQRSYASPPSYESKFISGFTNASYAIFNIIAFIEQDSHQTENLINPGDASSFLITLNAPFALTRIMRVFSGTSSSSSYKSIAITFTLQNNQIKLGFEKSITFNDQQGKNVYGSTGLIGWVYIYSN